MKQIIYISHAADQRIDTVRKLLENEGVTVNGSFDISVPDNVGEAIQAGMKAADAIIAIIGAEGKNVFYDLGFATALGKPILILLEPGVPVPGFASRDRHLVSNLKDSNVLRLGVKKFLNELQGRSIKRRNTRSSPPSKQPNRSDIRKVLEQLSRLRRSSNARQIERLVAELLNAAAVTAVEEYKGPEDRGVDFAVWSDAVQEQLGNPVLVEIKTGVLTGDHFRAAYRRLVDQVSQADARAGLLLYFDANDRRFHRPDMWMPSVLAIDLEDFAKELLVKSFAKALIEHRNRLVHGLP
jgi:hypothetical protein